jgi:hypothetical protein
MSTKTAGILISFFLCLCLLSGSFASAGQYGSVRDSEEQTVIVLPARYTIVKLGFDVARIRAVTLVSYEGDASSRSPVLHVWNSGMDEWVSTTIEAYSSTAAFDREPARAVLLGSGADLPTVLVTGSSWSTEVVQIPALSIVELVNGLDDVFDFSPREWRFLARRYKLTLTDLNAERRHYGRYGRPGSRPEPRRDVPSRLEDEVPMPDVDDFMTEIKGVRAVDDAAFVIPDNTDDPATIPELDELGLGEDDAEEEIVEPEPEDK